MNRNRHERRPPAPEKVPPMPFEARLAAARARREAALAAQVGAQDPMAGGHHEQALAPAGISRPGQPSLPARGAEARGRRRGGRLVALGAAAALAGLALLLPSRLPDPAPAGSGGDPGADAAKPATADPDLRRAAAGPEAAPPGPEAVPAPPAAEAAAPEGSARSAAGPPAPDGAVGPPSPVASPAPGPGLEGPAAAARDPGPPAAQPPAPPAAAAPRASLAGLAAGTRAALRVLVYHPRGLDPARVARVVETLRAGGVGTVVPMPVGAPVGEGGLYFYHEGDRPAALAVAAAVAGLAGDAGPRDFAGDRGGGGPLPRPGTLTLWLAGGP